ncbi:amidohydrolase [Eubacteriaceae bacterium ES2]|nr:amidohydrolase [Eubacteriaceae bacterium ES2]
MKKGLALINGKGITMEKEHPLCEGILICDGVIKQVGTTSEIRKAAVNENASVIDLHGQTFVPGLHDCHVHMMSTGLSAIGINLFDCYSVAAVLEKLSAEKSNDPNEWIFGYGLDESRLSEKRPPTADELDSVFKKRPVYLLDRGLHYTQVNTAAMQIMQISGDKEGLSPNKANQLNGRLHGQANSHARKYFFDKLSTKQREDAIRHTARMASQLGITTIHAMEGGDLASDEDIPVFLNIIDDLPLHVVLHWCTSQVEKAVNKGLKIVGTDILLDGSIGSRTAAFDEPYADDENSAGLLYFSDEWVTDYILKAHQSGLQTGFHAIGQRGIRQLLNCLEAALKRYPITNHRFRIEHFGFPDAADIQRAKELGAVISTQPAFTYLRGGPGSVYEDRVGPARNRRAYPLRSLLAAGLIVSGGSDSNVTPINPMLGIHAAVNPPYPENAISPDQALRLFTIDGAYTAKEEKIRGSFLPGKAGDITVLSDCPLTVATDKIKDIEVEMAISNGNITYQKGE